MHIKVLIIAVIKKGDKVLLRKKPDGSPPYKETWYIFGAELIPEKDAEITLRDHVRKQAGIEVKMIQQFSWDTEVKRDLDGVMKQFVYLDAICEYVSGELRPAVGVERLVWVPVENLDQYDNVPPSRKLFQKLGYINKQGRQGT